jgi:hypothetical protein
VRDPKPVGPPIPEPAEFRVTGGPKRIRVRSPGYDDKITEALTIFEDKRFYIDLAPSTTRGLESLGPELGRLSVSSPDPLARVSIIDGAGKEIASKYAYLDPVDLAPGPYLVRAELTASQRSEKNVDVRPGSVETISLSIPGSAPAPPLSQALEQVGIVYRDEAFDPSENLGTMSDARLGTILAYAVWAARWPPAAGFKRLRKLGADPITGLTPGMSAVQILIGDSANEAGFLDGCRAAIERGTGSPLLPGNVILISRGPAATNQALVPLSGLPQARQSSTPLPPGAYRVRIEMPGFASASFAVTLLAGFVTVFIVAREENGSVDIQQQFHPIDPTVPVLRGLPRPMLNDVRIVDLSRRALEGRDPLSDIEYGGLLERKRANPMLAIIAGYRMLGTPREDQFRGPAGTAPTPGTLGESPLWNMVAFFPGLPDVHVLAGLYDPAKRRQHFERAMAAGTPVLAEGFWRLLEWLTEKSAADKTAPPQLRQSLVPGTVWTAFAPPRPASPLGASRVVLPSGRALADAPDVRMAAAERAVGRLDVIGETGFLCSSFLVGPRTAVCPLHFALKFADEGPDGSWTIRLPTVFNVVPGSDASVRKVVRVLRTIRPPAGTDLDRGPLPRELLDQCWPVLLELDADTSPGALSISTLAAAVGQRVAVIGFPRSDVRVPPGVFAELFAGAAGEKHLMPGAVLRAAGTGPLFDYDCFTADGTSGGPVVDAATGLVLGMHVAASPVQDGRKRGMAVALSSLAAVFKDQR